MNKSKWLSIIFICAAFNLVSCAKSRHKPIRKVGGAAAAAKADDLAHLNKAEGANTKAATCTTPIKAEAKPGEKLLAGGLYSGKGKWMMESISLHSLRMASSEKDTPATIQGELLGILELGTDAIKKYDKQGRVTCHNGSETSSVNTQFKMPNELDLDKKVIKSEVKLTLQARNGATAAGAEVTVSGQAIQKDVKLDKSDKVVVVETADGKLVMRFQVGMSVEGGLNKENLTAEITFRKKQ